MTKNLFFKIILIFRVQDESVQSSNRGNFAEILSFVSEFSPRVASKISDEFEFSLDVSRIIENYLVSSISEVLHKEIIDQIKNSTFVSIILEEGSEKSQLSVIFRYFYEGSVYERFAGFVDVSKDRSADDLFLIIRKLLEEYDLTDKLVAQCYDGTIVIPGHLETLQAKVKTIASKAEYVHCVAHPVNQILEQSLVGKKATYKCKLFFATIKSVSAFFNHSFKTNAKVMEFIKKTVPSLCESPSDSLGQILIVVHDNIEEVTKFFEDVIDNPSDWDADTLQKAEAYLNFLSGVGNRFLVSVLKDIFSLSDMLYNTLHLKSLDTLLCHHEVETIIRNITINNETKFMESWNYASLSNTALKRNESKEGFRELQSEIIRTVKTEFESRFQFLSGFCFLKLLNCLHFKEFQKTFPDKLIKDLEDKYGKKLFDYAKLKIELTTVYANEQMARFSIYELMNFLISMRMENLYADIAEVSRLAQLILTFPSTPLSSDRSAVKRNYKAKRSTQNQDGKLDLNLLTIEKELLLKMKCEPSFYDKVIAVFVKKTGKTDLIYR